MTINKCAARTKQKKVKSSCFSSKTTDTFHSAGFTGTERQKKGPQASALQSKSTVAKNFILIKPQLTTKLQDDAGIILDLKDFSPFSLVVLLVVLLFYVHGKHLRSCRDGQLT